MVIDVGIKISNELFDNANDLRKFCKNSQKVNFEYTSILFNSISK